MLQYQFQRHCIIFTIWVISLYNTNRASHVDHAVSTCLVLLKKKDKPALVQCWTNVCDVGSALNQCLGISHLRGALHLNFGASSLEVWIINDSPRLTNDLSLVRPPSEDPLRTANHIILSRSGSALCCGPWIFQNSLETQPVHRSYMIRRRQGITAHWMMELVSNLKSSLTLRRMYCVNPTQNQRIVCVIYSTMFHNYTSLIWTCYSLV